jgi:thiamine kinase-like enzyme
MFFELHGMLVEVEGVTVYQPTRLHVNLSKAIQKQENEEIVNSNRRFKASPTNGTVTVGNSSMRSYLSTVANNVAEINSAANSVSNNSEDLTHLKRTLAAKKKVIDSMADATKNYLKTMSELSTKLELLEQLLAN